MIKKISKNQIISQILREIRHDVGLSQEQVGLRMNVSKNYISLLERGERTPGVLQRIRLCDALGVPPESVIRRIADKYRGKAAADA